MRSSELEKIEVIFFDVDDTLFEQKKAHKETLYRIKDSYDFFEGIGMNELTRTFEETDKEAIEEFRNGVPMKELRWNRSEKFLKKIGVDEDLTETFHEEFYRIYPTLPMGIEGAEETVKYLASGYELGILTNSTEEVQMKKIHALDLAEYFDLFIFSEEVGSRKPDEGIFLHALEKVDKSSDRCLYVGNSYRSDIEGASKVGMRTCWLNREGEKRGDMQKPTLEIKKLRELLEIL
ncbi:MAG: HAD family hydrolase [Candidatus Thermoplasmatota archaeon]